VRAREARLPLFLIGHSLGGAVVTLYTVERKPPLAGLILLAPALRLDRLPIETAATPLTAMLAPNLPVVNVPDEVRSRSPAVVAELRRDPLIYHEVGPARTAGGLIEALGRIWARADELDVPLLALHGTGDKVTDPRGSAEIVHRARTRDRRLVLYRDLFHDLVLEPERDQVMTDVERWIDERTPP
jgi:alpha-beta hydrolase superfamily lysophospholipase